MPNIVQKYFLLFINEFHEQGFPKDWEYIIIVPDNLETVDMNKVVEFYENITSKNDYKEAMGNCVVKHWTWDNII